MKLYLALIRQKEIHRMEFEWRPLIEALNYVKSVVKNELGPEWHGNVIIDSRPILQDDLPVMLFGKVDLESGDCTISPQEIKWTHPIDRQPE